MIYKHLGNTYKYGTATFLFLIRKSGIIGVCLEMNIVKEGKKFEGVKRELIETVQDYVDTVTKENLPEYLLNRPAPKEYWEIYKKYLQSELRALEVTVRDKSIPKRDESILIEKTPFPQLAYC